MVNFRDIHKRYGFVGMLLNLLFKFLKIVGVELEANYLLQKEILPFSKEEEELVLGWGMQHLTLQDFERYGDIDWFTGKKLEHIKTLLKFPTENTCFGIIQNEQLICSGWLSLYYLDWGGGRLLLPNKVGYLWDTYTNPALRGNGFHGKLIKYRLYQLSVKEYEKAYSTVAVYNKASYKGFRRNGFTKKQLFFTYKFWNGKRKTTLKLV